MAQTKKKQANPLINSIAKPTTLDAASKIDIDTKHTLADNIIEAGINGGLDISSLEHFTTISNSRDQMYQLIDTMAQDAAVSSVLRVYAEDVCELADNGHVIWAESNDPKVSKFVNYLLNVMNVDKHMYSWAYSLVKYGDLYLKLFRESDYNDPLFHKDSINNKATLNENIQSDTKLDEAVNLAIHSANDPYSYYVEMQADPGAMFELTKYGKTFGYIEVPVTNTGLSYLDNYLVTNNQANQNYRLRSSDVTVYQADDFVHACLDDANSRYPETVEIFINEDAYKNGSNGSAYTVKRGKSILFDSYKIWREKSLLENSALLNRITKSSLVRNISVEVGDMPKEQVQQTLRRVKDLFEQKSAFNVGNSMTEYTNPGPVENNIFTATHNGQGTITVNSVGGDVEVSKLADLDWWNNKFYASYGIPKQFFGFTADSTGFNGGTSLTIISSVYAKGVKRVQNSLIQAITDAVNLFLINRGLRGYINNFVLKMKTPITQEEIDYRSDFSNRVSAISSMQSLLSDIEDKARRLEILKALIGTLNYSDDILQQIQAEIDAVKTKQRKQQEEEAQNNTATDDNTEASSDTTVEEEDTDLPPASTEESFNSITVGNILLEDAAVPGSADLPTPELLEQDFTKNK